VTPRANKEAKTKAKPATKKAASKPAPSKKVAHTAKGASSPKPAGKKEVSKAAVKQAPAKAAQKVPAKAQPPKPAPRVKAVPPAPGKSAAPAKSKPSPAAKPIKAKAPETAAAAAAKPTAKVVNAQALKSIVKSVTKVLAIKKSRDSGKQVKDSAAKTTASAQPATTPAAAVPSIKADRLAKLLELRAKDTKTAAAAAAKEARRGAARVPTSVAKAAEFAETRKISTIVKKRTVPVKPEAPAPNATAEAEKRKAAAKRRKAPYSRTELKELRDILESERNRLRRDMETLNDVAASSEESMSRTFSNHQADAATDSSALETMFVTRRYEEERLGQVVHALQRLEEGTYGLCEMCADEPQKLCESCPFIPIGRLRAKPFAKLCVPCRQELEKKNGGNGRR